MESKALYKDFHRVDLEHLREQINSGRIDNAVAEKFLEYWQRRLSDSKDALYSHYIEYYLFFESLRALFFAVFLFEGKEGMIRHTYGIYPTLGSAIWAALVKEEISQDASVSFEHGGQSYVLHRIHSGFHDQEYTIAALSFKGVEATESLARMKYVFERYYMPSSFAKDDSVGLLFPATVELVKWWVEKPLEKNIPVTFTYLYFESMSKYVSLAGSHFANELLSELQTDIHRLMKDTDRSIILSTREFLIVSINCDEEVLKKRFRKAFFQAKGLILSYSIRFHCVRELPLDFFALWNQITGNLPYNKKLA